MGKKEGESIDSRKTTRLSKALTQLLRHSGRKEGLKIGSDGFALLDDVLACSAIAALKLNPTFFDIQKLVAESDKQRFGLKEDERARIWIRANQGHSMEGIDMNELCGTPITELQPGEVCCHGTYERHLGSILKDGLKAGGAMGQKFRRDVHFSIAPPGDEVISGMRQNCQIAVYVDVPKASGAGIHFFRSANHVILSEGTNGIIPPEFIESIWHIQRKTRLYPAKSSRPSPDAATGATSCNTTAATAAQASSAKPPVKVPEEKREVPDSWDDAEEPVPMTEEAKPEENGNDALRCADLDSCYEDELSCRIKAYQLGVHIPFCRKL